MATQVWKIRFAGCPTNPRYRNNRRRTASVITNAEGAKNYAESLARGQHVKILEIEEAVQ